MGYIRIYRVNLNGLSILSGLSAPAPILSGQPMLALGSVGAAGLAPTSVGAAAAGSHFCRGSRGKSMAWNPSPRNTTAPRIMALTAR